MIMRLRVIIMFGFWSLGPRWKKGWCEMACYTRLGDISESLLTLAT